MNEQIHMFSIHIHEEFEMKGKRRRGRSSKTWKTQVEKVSKSVGLEKEDTLTRARWRVGVGEIAVRVG